jgi:hypothetical protein
MRKKNWKKYAFEFLSIFIAVISAFALNNWNENRRDNDSAMKILTEISNGLNKDLEDIRGNIGGHEKGIQACNYWRNVVLNKEIKVDSLQQHYLTLTRDFFSAQNVSGYETLKSKGLELIRNDSLRYGIISLYEYDYGALKTLEEEYYEMQFQENYYREINKIISPYFEFDETGSVFKLNTPLRLPPKEKNIILTYLWKIHVNRVFILRFYADMERKISDLNELIAIELRG